MRHYVIVGAGAVGGAIGGALALAGHHVTLIARGAHLEALRERGLTLVTPDATHVLRLDVAERAETTCDAVIVATKSQDTGAALAPVRDRRVPIVCAQNGVANERLAAERFDHVISMVVFAPLSHLEPGIVSVHSAPHWGGIDLGLWPRGLDTRCDRLADDLGAARFDVRGRNDIARWKYGKLLTNLGNALDAMLARGTIPAPWITAIVDEARACLTAAAIEHASLADVLARFANVREVGARGGGSTWQSLARGQPLETDFLNGEIVALGRSFGIATPWNDALVALAHRAEAERWAAGSRTPEALSPWLPPKSSPAPR
jgi:2-dehydropantoate 2-reductase